MNPFITSPHSIHLQQETLDAEIRDLTKQIEALPEGSATVYYDNGYKKMRGIVNGKRRIFNQKDLPLVHDLILRKYLTKKRTELIHAKSVLKAHSVFENRYEGIAEEYLMDNPLRAEILKDVFIIKDLSLRKWAEAPDQCAGPHQEERTEETLFGLLVRSKAEVMIATFLYENKIPFRYEEPLLLNGQIYCPDFTIRDPKTGAFFWYEHFGKMDDPRYVRDVFRKLVVYADNGIIPSVNLITTFETKNHKLSFPQIRSAVATVI